MTNKKIKAVIPAAGLGTRFLPLTKAQPKEMLPVVNKPTIQWVVEEAVDAGIQDIAIITGKYKKSIEAHFNPSEELEYNLEKLGKFKELEEIKYITKIANITFIVQEEPKGLGDALICAKEYVGNDPFAVLLGDTICVGNPNCTKELVDIFHKTKANIFSVEKIKPEETRRYGIVSGKKIDDRLMLVDNLVEKPETEAAPSLLGIQGRYIFTPDIFNCLQDIPIGKEGEIQLTDAMQRLTRNFDLYSWTFSGKRYDIGTMKDWFKSHLELSLKSDFSGAIKEVLEGL